VEQPMAAKATRPKIAKLLRMTPPIEFLLERVPE